MALILVVDDNQQNAEMLETLLKGHDHEVMVAENGVAALELARQTLPDIVVTDILMPEMDGFTLCRYWKKDEVLKKKPFVFYTATYTDPRDEELGLNLGADAFVRKPSKPEQIMQALESVLEQDPSNSPTSTKKDLPDESVLLRQYNEALVRKLEKKIVQLTEVNKRLQQEMVQKQSLLSELAHASRVSSMGEMATTLAHEVTQPLAAITNYTGTCNSLLESEQFGLDDLRDTLSKINHQAFRAGEIVNRLKRFVAKTAPTFSSLDLNELVRDVSSLMRSEIQKTQTRLELDLSDTLPVVQGDAIQIQQVLVNLIQNALDAMSGTEPGRRLITLTTAESDEFLRVSVCDCGSGLSPDIEGRLFESYFTTKEDGLGVGLKISQRIIQSHGGSLKGTSNPDGGMTFEFTLPLKQPSPKDVLSVNGS